jgi:hypothetical protein
MKKLILIATLGICTIFLASIYFKTSPAISVFNSLSSEQQAKAKYDFNDQDRFQWHYLPATSFKRPGIALTDLDPKQKEMVFELLKANLSKSGYDKTMSIIDLENVLAEIEGNTERRDPEKYHIAFYGDPNDAAWAWSFQGHHVALHFTISGDRVAFVPRFLGANPAMIKEGKRKGERTLRMEEDLGFELINDLSDAQKAKAIIPNHQFGDIKTANSAEAHPLDPFGIKTQELNENQNEMLKAIIKEYLSIMPDDLAAHRLNRLREEDMNEIRFAWAGSFKLGAAHYYRIQGKTFLIEFDNSQNNANHIHSVWRDFNGDFGRDLIKEHYQNTEHH